MLRETLISQCRSTGCGRPSRRFKRHLRLRRPPGRFGSTGALPGRDVKIASALALAPHRRCRPGECAGRRAEKNEPNNAYLKLYWLPAINAQIELTKNNARQTIHDLESTTSYELGTGRLVHQIR